MDNLTFPTLSTEFLDAMHIEKPQASAAAVAAAAAATPVAPPDAPASAASQTSEAVQRLSQMLAHALELAPQVIDNLVGRALMMLDRSATSQADEHGRRPLDSAAAGMEAHRSRWVKQFQTMLRIASVHPLPAAQAAKLPAADIRICAKELAELDALVLAAGSQRDNPLAPRAYVQAIVELVARSEGTPEQRQHWQQYLLHALGTQLAWVYPQLITSLRSPGSHEPSAMLQEPDFIAMSAYAFGLSEKAPPSEPSAIGEDLQSHMQAKLEFTPEMKALAQEARSTVKRLRKALELPDPPPDESQDEMAQLMSDIDEAERLMQEMQARGLELPEPEGPISQEKLLEKVDRILMNCYNATTPALTRVPQPVRAELERLHASLVALGRAEEDFLSNDQHPARQLLDAISSNSLRYTLDDADNKAAFETFLNAIRKLIDALIQVQQPSGKVYSQALAKMQPVWQQLEQLLKQAEERKEIALSQKEERKQLAGRLAFELVARRDAGDAPGSIKQFLMGPWAQVLARARMHPQYAHDDHRYTNTVALLLWSVSERRAGAYKSRLASLQPELVRQIQAGLKSVDTTQGEIDAFLGELNKLHDAVMASNIEPGSTKDDFPEDAFRSINGGLDISDMMQLDSGQRKQPPSPPQLLRRSEFTLIARPSVPLLRVQRNNFLRTK